MNTAERLEACYDFDVDVVNRVAEVMEYHNGKTIGELATMYGVQDGPRRVPVGDGHLEVLEFFPKGNYDRSYARVYNMSHGNTINDALTMNLSTLFAADPTSPLIMVGNPSGLGPTGGSVSLLDAVHMIRERKLGPAAEPVVRYLGGCGISTTAQIGYSYGADKAAAVSAIAPDFGISVSRGVFAEPVSVEEQPLRKLGMRFLSTNGPLKDYIQESGLEPYIRLREPEQSVLGMVRGGVPYLGGVFLRPTNIAIAKVLASGGYEDRLFKAVEANPDGRFTTAWGSESEMAKDSAMLGLVDDMVNHPQGDRMSYIRVRGMKHAGGDDPALHTAIFLQGLAA